MHETHAKCVRVEVSGTCIYRVCVNLHYLGVSIEWVIKLITAREDMTSLSIFHSYIPLTLHLLL